MKCCLVAGCLLFIITCTNIQKQDNGVDTASHTVIATVAADTTPVVIHQNNTTPQQVVDYAKTLIGIPYKYASTSPEQGFDCSGFITYVFNHFNIEVPRASVEFTHAYPEVAPANAKPGDLVLFTGTDPKQTTVGHMGILVANSNDSIHFIHSTSGKAHGVTITPLDAYYKSRFVKIVRVLPQ